MKRKAIKLGFKLIKKGLTTRKGLMILSGTIIGMFVLEILTIGIMIVSMFMKIKGIGKKRRKNKIREKKRVLKECRLQYKKQLENELEELENNNEMEFRKSEIINEIERLNIQFGI